MFICYVFVSLKYDSIKCVSSFVPYTLYFCHNKNVILLFCQSWQQLFPWARSSLCLKRYLFFIVLFYIFNNYLFIKLYIPYTYISVKTIGRLLFSCFARTLQQLFPRARSSLCLKYLFVLYCIMFVRIISLSKCIFLTVIFLTKQEEGCYFAVLSPKFATVVPSGKIKFMFKIYIS